MFFGQLPLQPISRIATKLRNKMEKGKIQTRILRILPKYRRHVAPHISRRLRPAISRRLFIFWHADFADYVDMLIKQINFALFALFARGQSHADFADSWRLRRFFYFFGMQILQIGLICY